MTRYLQCAEQQESASNFSKYCACHEKWISCLILVTHETLFTMRGGTSVIVQTHQILRLPRKMNLMIDPCHTWNAIYNARNNRWHPPTSPNTAPATKNDCHHWSSSHMKRYLQCAEQQVASSNITKYCACHAKWLSWLISMTYETLFTMRGTTGGILQHHQILRLPRKMTVMIDQHDIWNAIYNARNNRWHPPTSPNTAPATQNDCHDWSSSHMKRYETLFTMRGTTGGILQHHQILRLPRKMILQNFREISRKQLKRHFQCGADPSWIRAGSELDPSWIRPWSENETVTPQPASQPRLLFTPTTGILYWKIQHFALRLSFQISPNTAPATKSDTSTSPNTAPATKSDTWTSPNNAPATKSDTWTSPNSAPATKSDTWTSPNIYTNLISYESLLKRI